MWFLYQSCPLPLFCGVGVGLGGNIPGFPRILWLSLALSQRITGQACHGCILLRNSVSCLRHGSGAPCAPLSQSRVWWVSEFALNASAFFPTEPFQKQRKRQLNGLSLSAEFPLQSQSRIQWQCREEWARKSTSSSVLELLRICIHFKIERRGRLLILGGIDLVGLTLFFFGVSESYGPICIYILSVKMLHIIKAMLIHLWHQPHRFYSWRFSGWHVCSVSMVITRSPYSFPEVNKLNSSAEQPQVAATQQVEYTCSWALASSGRRGC